MMAKQAVREGKNEEPRKWVKSNTEVRQLFTLVQFQPVPQEKPTVSRASPRSRNSRVLTKIQVVCTHAEADVQISFPYQIVSVSLRHLGED